MEALFPYALRLAHAAKLKALKRKKDRKAARELIAALSKRYGIPGQWVGFYLRPRIMNQLRTYYDGV